MALETTISDGRYYHEDTSTGGAVNVNTNGAAGTLETISFVCNSAADCITDPTAPVTTELCLASGFAADKKRVRFTFHAHGIGVPHAAGALVTVNATTEGTALTRLTQADNAPQAAYRTTFVEARRISSSAAVAEYDLTGTDATVDDVAVGFVLPTGTGADTCYVTVEVW